MSVPKTYPGRIILDRYELQARLGSGASGSVWRARDRRRDRSCAIKILNRSCADDPRQRCRLASEGNLVSRLCHPNILVVHELNQDMDGTPFLVMELLRGQDLRSLLQQRGRLPLERALPIARQIASALDATHALGVLHRDIKPANLFLHRELDALGHEREIVKVVDFGLAGELGADGQAQMSVTSAMGGDLEYRSPEATYPDRRGLDGRSDQWSLAVVLYEMLAGVRPFQDADPVRLMLKIRQAEPTPLSLHVPELPPSIVLAVDRALSGRKEQRYANLRDFMRAIEGVPISTAQVTPRPASVEKDIPASVVPAKMQPTPRSPPHRFVGLIGLLFLALSSPTVEKLAAQPTTSQPTAPLLQTPVIAPALPVTAPRRFPMLRLADASQLPGYPPLRLMAEDR